MAAGDEYRTKAVQFEAVAERETDSHKRLEFEILATAYRRLAHQAEQNQRFDLVWGPP
jgi:hypothetical protein